LGKKARNMDTQAKEIVGIVIIEVELEDYDRVRKQLLQLTEDTVPVIVANVIVYEGIIEPVFAKRDGHPSPVLFYLELAHGIWGDVVHWCDSAYRVGLIKGYRYAETGTMQIVLAQDKESEA